MMKSKVIVLILMAYATVLTGTAYSQSAIVENTWLEHGVTIGGEKGMRIHSKVTVNGLKGKKIEVLAYFYDSNKNYLKGGISGYLTTSGSPCVSYKETAPYEGTVWNDFTLFMPNRAIPMYSGTNTYYVAVYVYDVQGKRFLTDNPSYVSFSGTGSGNSRPYVAQQNNLQQNNPAGTGQGSVTFEKIWTESDVYQNNVKGFKVHVAFSISGMRNQRCKAVAYFDCPQGNGLPDINGKYCTTSGTVCATRDFTPGYDNTKYEDVAMFLPDDEFHLLEGDHHYFTRVFIQGPSGKLLPGNSDFVEVLHAELTVSRTPGHVYNHVTVFVDPSATTTGNSPTTAQQKTPNIAQKNKLQIKEPSKPKPQDGDIYYYAEIDTNSGVINDSSIIAVQFNGNLIRYDKLYRSYYKDFETFKQESRQNFASGNSDKYLRARLLGTSPRLYYSRALYPASIYYAFNEAYGYLRESINEGGYYHMIANYVLVDEDVIK